MLDGPAPELGDNYTTIASVERHRLYPDGKRYTDVSPGEAIVINALDPAASMMITEDGTARFFRKRDRQSFPYNRNVFIGTRKFQIAHPFMRPPGELLKFFEECRRKVFKQKESSNGTSSGNLKPPTRRD